MIITDVIATWIEIEKIIKHVGRTVEKRLQESISRRILLNNVPLWTKRNDRSKNRTVCTRSHGVSGVRDFGIGRCGGGGGPALRWELGRVLSIIEVEAFQVIA